jgi:hypothetical protein
MAFTYLPFNEKYEFLPAFFTYFCRHVWFPVLEWKLINARIRTPDFLALPEFRNFQITIVLHVQDNGIQYYRLTTMLN